MVVNMKTIVLRKVVDVKRADALKKSVEKKIPLKERHCISSYRIPTDRTGLGRYNSMDYCYGP
jgi:hypothetical protein